MPLMPPQLQNLLPRCRVTPPVFWRYSISKSFRALADMQCISLFLFNYGENWNFSVQFRRLRCG